MSTWRGFTGLKGQVKHENTHGIGVAVILGILLAVLILAFADSVRAAPACKTVDEAKAALSKSVPDAKISVYDGTVGDRMIGYFDALIDALGVSAFPPADKLLVADDGKGDGAVMLVRGNCVTVKLPVDADQFNDILHRIQRSTTAAPKMQRDAPKAPQGKDDSGDV